MRNCKHFFEGYEEYGKGSRDSQLQDSSRLIWQTWPLENGRQAFLLLIVLGSEVESDKLHALHLLVSCCVGRPLPFPDLHKYNNIPSTLPTSQLQSINGVFSPVTWPQNEAWTHEFSYSSSAPSLGHPHCWFTWRQCVSKGGATTKRFLRSIEIVFVPELLGTLETATIAKMLWKSAKIAEPYSKSSINPHRMRYPQMKNHLINTAPQNSSNRMPRMVEP